MPTLALPAKAWYGDVEAELSIPDNWVVEVLRPDDAEALHPRDLAEALRSPVGCPGLAELARDKGNALIVVDDLGRPTRAGDIVPGVVQILAEAGIAAERISILVATGSHRPLSDDDIRRKLGTDIAARFETASHDAFGDELEDLGRLPSGVPVIVNRRVAAADLVVGISCVIPHKLTGFTGGGKLMLPGASGILSIANLHSFEKKRRRGALERSGQAPDVRDMIGDYARHAGLDFSINAVVNSRRQLAGLFCGCPIEAHRRAASRASQVYHTQIPDEVRRGTDILLLNAYPLDADPVQASKPLWARSLFPGAQAILLDPACDGIAYHGWNEFKRASLGNLLWAGGGRRAPRGLGNRHFRAGLCERPTSSERFAAEDDVFFANSIAKRLTADRAPLWICSERFPEYKRRQQFPNGRLFATWDEILASGLLGTGPRRLTVLPCAPLQLP